MDSVFECSHEPPRFQRVFDLLQHHRTTSPAASAIQAPGRTPLSYDCLYRSVSAFAAALQAAGVMRGDRVAIVLPNGPEMAVAFLAASALATAAPLNPAYGESELDFYLSDLDARVMVTQRGSDAAARSSAAKAGIPVVELERAEAAAGGGGAPFSSAAEPDDVALVLHTSGTTARPKLVPLTHRNLCASACNVRDALALTEADSCLNVMPLFHIHGIVAVVLASLAAGARFVATPGFLATHVFDWLREFRPTWYTAVPTMHQAILARFEPGAAAGLPPLRFIRSSSAPLPPQVMQSLERAFSAPVIEAYGMTEAAHQMASNPLPPRIRKPGSVGIAAGPEIAVMDDAGNLLPAGCAGEIVIRGPNVMGGYASNPEANEKAFSGGWLRTGDQGYLDEEGYLFITGRIKEIINRGGEKVSPREVEETLLEHPAVAQAVVFAIPDEVLGEDVGAAVVLRDPAVSEAQLRRHAAARLAAFKVPCRVVTLDEIPKGPTGKPQRIGLAARLGIGSAQAPANDVKTRTAPANELEEGLLHLWREVLRTSSVGVEDRFLDAGGDSVLAAQLVARLRQQLQIDITLIDFLDRPTVAEQAQFIETLLVQEMEALSDEEPHRLEQGNERG